MQTPVSYPYQLQPFGFIEIQLNRDTINDSTDATPVTFVSSQEEDAALNLFVESFSFGM